jgi:hypothetical protein
MREVLNNWLVRIVLSWPPDSLDLDILGNCEKSGATTESEDD